ncbi:XdhC family protein [Sphingobium indicum]|nr:XdhC family protein [Sphingobium indicum]
MDGACRPEADHSAMNEALSLFRFLGDCARRGERTALVTLTDVTGGSARAPGTHMAVSECGASIGSFSGGCVEAAVIAEAQQVILAGQPRTLRLGAGSPYIDIRLPCGGGIDLIFTPQPALDQIDRLCVLLEQRQPVAVSLTTGGQFDIAAAAAGDRTCWQDSRFVVRHDPALRLVVIGHGAEPGALLRLALAYGAEALLLSPDSRCIDDAKRIGVPTVRLWTTGRCDRLATDAHTAIVMLFHDHDWETVLLLQALEQDPFYIGAMGSRRTQAERRQRLLDAGGFPAAIDRIVGPIGMIPATRDPRTMAVSILAQVVSAYESMIRDGSSSTVSI